MKGFGLFADLHIHPYARFATVSKRGLNSWVETALGVLDQVYSKCTELGIMDVWCLGDLFHVGSRLYTSTFNAVYRFFEDAHAAGFRTVLIAGNHDLVARGADDSALLGLRGVVDRVVCEKPEYCEFPGYEVLFVPWTEDYEGLRKVIEEFTCSGSRTSTPGVIVGHLAVEGAVVGRDEYQPEEGCGLSLFDGADVVFLGHYHKRQYVGDNPDVIYIGSAMSHSFHDSGETKGLTVVEAVDGGLRQRLETIRSPGFLVCSEQGLPNPNSASGNIVRVDYEGELDEDSVRKSLLAYGARAVTFNRRTVREIEERVSDPERDLEGCIREYVSRRGEGFDGEELVRLGLDIVRSPEETGGD